MLEIKPIYTEIIDYVKLIADANRESVGFMTKKKFEEIIKQRRGFVALQNDNVVGFVIYRHRKRDLQTTLSEICVHKDYRQQHIGYELMSMLIKDCKQRNREFIQLKCPVDLEANGFYERLGFKLHTIEKGKKRQLKVWRLAISPCQAE
jgi:ribosomal protein S18 acetylase RimI-like enzyme